MILLLVKTMIFLSSSIYACTGGVVTKSIFEQKINNVLVYNKKIKSFDILEQVFEFGYFFHLVLH